MSAAAPKTFTLEPYDYGEARALMEALDLAEPVAVTLVRRGYRTVEEARAFLEAADDHDPFGFEGMAEVVERLRAATADGRLITVHGDYDVDGVCSTAILVAALRRLGARCDWLIPDRMGDGYGLTEATAELLARRGTGLLLTADCGIGSVAEVAAAQAAGIEVIVTDHHQPGPELPTCPILHPVVSGYPCAELCATGVAYKLAAALHGADAVAGELDLVALATVADLVPLRGENRALVRRGLVVARQARRPGLRALIEAASIHPERLDEGDIAFRLGPRINAAGRLYRADAGVELMLTADEERAARIAAELDRANHERREVEREVLQGAEQALRALPPELATAPGVVLAGEGWHPGVVGIVASRMVERLGKPVVLASFDAEGRGRGSGRSIAGFDLLAALDSCASHLGRYGGHAAAAGVELERPSLAAFSEAFAHACEGASSGPSPDVVDAIVGVDGLGHSVAAQLARLAPFGNGNPGVRLLVPGARLDDVRPMGDGERHARFSLRSGAGSALGVAFGVDRELEEVARSGPIDVAVRLELNEWNGSVSPRVVLGGLYPLADGLDRDGQGAGCEGLDEAEFWERFDAELGREPAERPEPGVAAAPARTELRRGSAVAAIAALASGGGSVLVVCADASRRRELIERAARPARFGGGALAVASGRDPFATIAAARVVRDAGSATVLVDWPLLARETRFAVGFEHVVVVDPASSAADAARARTGAGYLHHVDGPAELDFALRCLAEEWPSRGSLGDVYRALRAAGGEGSDRLPAEAARRALCGERRAHPRSPEVAARHARVLAELGLIVWEGSGTERALGVVSSKGTDLERSEAYRAYQRRFEEGREWLTRRRPKSG